MRQARVERRAVRAVPGCRSRRSRAPSQSSTAIRTAAPGACATRSPSGYGVAFEEVAVGAGADGLIDCLSQASLDPGDEIVCGWPSFPSYVIDAVKLGAVPVKVPLRDHRYDLDAMLEAITPRTNLVYVCHPNNPTGTMNTRAELDAFLDRVPGSRPGRDRPGLPRVRRRPGVPGCDRGVLSSAGRPVAVLRTFSKIYGLAGLRVGYMVAPPAVVTAANKVKRAFDVSTRPRRRRRSRASTTPRRSPAPAAERGVARPARRRSSKRLDSRPPGRRSPTSSTPRRAPTRGRCSRRCWPRA